MVLLILLSICSLVICGQDEFPLRAMKAQYVNNEYFSIQSKPKLQKSGDLHIKKYENGKIPFWVNQKGGYLYLQNWYSYQFGDVMWQHHLCMLPVIPLPFEQIVVSQRVDITGHDQRWFTLSFFMTLNHKLTGSIKLVIMGNQEKIGEFVLDSSTEIKVFQLKKATRICFSAKIIDLTFRIVQYGEKIGPQSPSPFVGISKVELGQEKTAGSCVKDGKKIKWKPVSES